MGDIKNYQSTSESGSDGKPAKAPMKSKELYPIKLIDKVTEENNYFEGNFSSEPVNYEKIWADKFCLSDDDVNRVLAPGFYGYDDLKAVPPPSPECPLVEGNLNLIFF